jgi:glyoxylase-like metal-dependent hydrolase (beta-lactamase superfamily II)
MSTTVPGPSLFASLATTTTGVREATPAQVAAARGTARLVDVREPDEFIGELGHVAGAELVPLGTVARHTAGWDRETELIMICRSGGRSGRAAAELVAAGFRRVVNMAGGMLAWNAAGLPVDRTAPPARVHVEPFYDDRTFTLTFVVSDPATKDAVVIDPVLDYDPHAGLTWTESVDRVTEYVRRAGLRLHYVLETHAHADHLSGSQLLRRRFDAKIAIGERIREVQATFRPIFDLPASFATDGSQFDRLLRDGEVLEAGSLRIGVMSTPGHTPACVSFHIGDAVFTGDALFTEDYGTGRCDFPRGSADDLYTSVQRLYALPDETRVFVGHDYQPGGRVVRWETSIGASKAKNPQLSATTTREAFVAARNARDKTLAAPRLLLPSVQINIDAGRLPAPHAGGNRYIMVPLNVLRPADELGEPRPAGAA